MPRKSASRKWPIFAAACSAFEPGPVAVWDGAAEKAAAGARVSAALPASSLKAGEASRKSGEASVAGPFPELAAAEFREADPLSGTDPASAERRRAATSDSSRGQPQGAVSWREDKLIVVP